jgi:hypothetical protein
MPDPKKGVAYTFTASLVDAANRPQLKANPTLAAGDGATTLTVVITSESAQR